MEGGYGLAEEGPWRMGRKGGTEQGPALFSVPSGGTDEQVFHRAKDWGRTQAARALVWKAVSWKGGDGTSTMSFGLAR